MPKEKTDILKIYKVCLPSWVCWPGKVTLQVCYTKEGAKQYIEDYPIRWYTPWMTIEEQELLIFQETD